MTFNSNIRAGRRLAAVLVALAIVGSSADEPSPKPTTRAEATAIISNARKILTPNGVERLERVRIGGIDQWVSIRGTDRRNPVLLYVHGGPGYVSIPMSWWFARGLEEYFTVVQWDQRAAGKTYLLTDPAKIASTLTTERMISDVEEMVIWARSEFGKDKIFVLAHSYGSFLGLQLAQRHPEWLYAYIGVCQSINGPENEQRGWRFAIDAARRAGNSEAVRELEAIAPYPPPGQPLPIKDLYTQRKWVGYFGGVMAYRTDNSADSALAQLSPDYSDQEISHIWDGNKFATPYLLPDLVATNLTKISKLAVPLILFEGRHDMNVNSEIASHWFETVKAPEKHLVWFEHSGHMPMTEEPGNFLLSLVRYARPIAERAGDTQSAAR
ncbi:MAG TPA: alpha/beta hydrolase [Terriglobales bacterium]|nr:alpha/beta hydrolase [Terriglobales bacterium]